MRATAAWYLALILAACGGCRACHEHDKPGSTTADKDEATEEGGDKSEEAEEREASRPMYWRATLSIEGHGRVADATGAFDCHRDDGPQSGTCGPKLVTYTELHPPLLVATPAPGWRFVRWDLIVRGADGSVHPRKLPPPDGPRYVNGFGYSDTGELETVTPVFEQTTTAAPAPPASPSMH